VAIFLRQLRYRSTTESDSQWRVNFGHLPTVVSRAYWFQTLTFQVNRKLRSRPVHNGLPLMEACRTSWVSASLHVPVQTIRRILALENRTAVGQVALRQKLTLSRPRQVIRLRSSPLNSLVDQRSAGEFRSITRQDEVMSRSRASGLPSTLRTSRATDRVSTTA